MILVILTVVAIAFLITVLAIFIGTLGVLLNGIAGHLDECLKNLQNIVRHVAVIAPGVKRINQTGKDLAGALPLLHEGVESLIAKNSAALAAPAAAVPVGVGYMDV